MSKKKDVFACYNQADQAVVKFLLERLQEKGIESSLDRWHAASAGRGAIFKVN